MTGPLLRIDIQGRDGLSLREVWKAGPRNYLGLQVAGFPNLFTITGPGSPSVLCNMPVAIEQHAEWIADCIRHCGRKGMDTDRSAIRGAGPLGGPGQRSRHPSRCCRWPPHSWYHGANIPGKPQVFMPYAGGMVRYREICNDIAARNYDGFILSAAETAEPATA